MAKTDITVRELIDKIKNGDLLLPEMQRRYVWPATRVRDLLDSLYREYPTGTILVWQTDLDIETKDIAIEGKKDSIMSNRLLLLDGQQRLTSLAAIVTGSKIKVRNYSKPIDILFNLEHPEGPPVEVTEIEEDENIDENGDGNNQDKTYNRL